MGVGGRCGWCVLDPIVFIWMLLAFEPSAVVFLIRFCIQISYRCIACLVTVTVPQVPNLSSGGKNGWASATAVAIAAAPVLPVMLAALQQVTADANRHVVPVGQCAPRVQATTAKAVIVR